MSFLKSIIFIISFACILSFVQSSSCTSSKIQECTNQNVLCVSKTDDDTQSCSCILMYNECLEKLGCDPKKYTIGKGDNSGNANGQFDTIRQSCVSFKCNPVGICASGAERMFQISIFATISFVLIMSFM